MRFWNRCNKLIEIDANSFVKCHWNKITSRCSEFTECRWNKQTLKQTKRNESNQNFLFDVLKLFVDLLIWCEFVVVCDFYFSLYQTMFQRFKKMNIVKIILKLMSKLTRKHENRLLTECRLISTNKKIDYWIVSLIWKCFM